MPYQKAGVAYAGSVGRCLIADQMGLGKTVEAIASLEYRDAFPAIIVCPASLKENWKREINKWLPHRSVNILSGKGNIANVDVNIVNYDIIGRFVEPIMHLKPMGLVLDESHYVKTSKTKRTEAVRDIAKKVPQSGTVLLLSGTPVTNRPEELVSQLEILGMLSRFGGKWAFLKRYTNAYHNGFGWDTKGASNLNELNMKLRQNCYIRRTKDEVLKELPAKTRNVVHVEPSGKGYAEYRKAEGDLLAFLAENGYRASDTAEHLRRTTVLKRLAADAKMESVIEWIDSFLESCDRKLVVFAHNVAIVDYLAGKYGNLRVSGQDSMEDRQHAVDSFQKDPKARVIVLNLQAGGVGLTLTAGSDVCFVQQGWTPGEHDQAEDRCHRIGQQNSVQAWYLIGVNTIDEDIYDLIDAKRAVVDAVTEGDEVQQASVVGDLMKRLYAKTKP
jgi:SNF2 family DNA or RNA helicase